VSPFVAFQWSQSVLCFYRLCPIRSVPHAYRQNKIKSYEEKRGQVGKCGNRIMENIQLPLTKVYNSALPTNIPLFRPSILLLLPLVITFLHPHCHSLYSTTTNERTNERTNKRTVTLLFSRRVHLLLTITNFLPFASFLFVLTLDRLQR
jgi:hypothetical protein